MITRVEGAFWPKDNMPVWRYLSFDKFFNFLLYRQIQFTRAALFTDLNELGLFGDGSGGNTTTQKKGSAIERDINSLRESTYVSCWSLGRSESYPLWKIYLGGSRNGVAIRTTVGRLHNSLESSKREFYTAGVQYRDKIFDTEPSDEQVICTKTEAYSYEKEFRIFTRHKDSDDTSKFTPNVVSEAIDLEEMSPRIYVSPFSSDWFMSTVQDALNYLAPDLSLRVEKSTIQDQ
jgi:hypothetical protein